MSNIFCIYLTQILRMTTEPIKQINCEKCGKKTPVSIVYIKGEAVVSVFCRHCKHLTTVKIKDEIEG
jgi:transcription elongation factor Elf1